MKLAILCSSFLPKAAGAEIFHHNLSVHLSRRGHDVVILAPSPNVRAIRAKDWKLPYRLIAVPRVLFSLIKHHGPRWLAPLALYLRWVQRGERFDHWHAVSLYPAGAALLRSRIMPWLARATGDDVQLVPGVEYGLRRDRAVDLVVRETIAAAESLVALTEDVRQTFMELGANRDAVQVIPNAVDALRFEAKDRKSLRVELGWPDGRFVFLCVSRAHPKKGLPHLLEAALRLYQSGCANFLLVIVGKDCPGLALPEGLPREMVRLYEALGPRPDGEGIPLAPSDELIGMYLAADAFVFPTLVETFGSVLLEAMAAGLPLIVTDAEGCRDVIGRGEHAHVVPVADASALEKAMGRMMNDPEWRADLRRKSIERGRAFGWEAVAAKYEARYASNIRQLEVRRHRPAG